MKILGIDGCHFGWLMVKINTKSKNYDINKSLSEIISQSSLTVEKYSSFNDLYEKNYDFDICLIDIPIGMIKGGNITRKADSAGRGYLKKIDGSTSSIFPTPCRRALYAETYEESNILNRKLTGKGLSKQTWNICPKIRDLDKFLQNNKNLVEKIFESGPELCFGKLNGDKAIKESKRTKIGIEKRLNLISSVNEKLYELFIESSKKFLKKDVKQDDILDAIILSISALKGKNRLEFLPEKFEYDEIGLPMRIAIPNFEIDS